MFNLFTKVTSALSEAVELESSKDHEQLKEKYNTEFDLKSEDLHNDFLRGVQESKDRFDREYEAMNARHSEKAKEARKEQLNKHMNDLAEKSSLPQDKLNKRLEMLRKFHGTN